MAKLVPMLGAVFAHAAMPAGQDRKQHPKPRHNKTTRGEKSVSQIHQQHGELASVAEPKPLSERMMMRDHAKHEMRRATEDWVSGRLTTHEHKAVHARGKHILAGKHPHEFHGKNGERKIKGLR